MYLEDIGRHPLLTAEQEVELAKAIETGRDILATTEVFEGTRDLPSSTAFNEAAMRDLLPLSEEQAHEVQAAYDARDQFVNSNLRLVVSIAKKYAGRGLDMLDLIQEGNLGLEHAVNRFDHRKGFKFSTYATWWIRQSITRGIAEKSRLVRLPLHAHAGLARFEKARRRAERDSAGEPVGRAALAKALDITEDAVEEWEQIERQAQPVSFDAPVSEEEGSATIGDMLPDTSTVDSGEVAANKELVERLLRESSEVEKEVLTLRFGLDGGGARTLEEVGKEFNVTRERIRQIEARAILKIQQRGHAAGLVPRPPRESVKPARRTPLQAWKEGGEYPTPPYVPSSSTDEVL